MNLTLILTDNNLRDAFHQAFADVDLDINGNGEFEKKEFKQF
jgi:hypothetical protein